MEKILVTGCAGFSPVELMMLIGVLEASRHWGEDPAEFARHLASLELGVQSAGRI